MQLNKRTEGELDGEMAACFSTLAWKIPWTEELGGLQSTGSQGVGHNCLSTHMGDRPSAEDRWNSHVDKTLASQAGWLCRDGGTGNSIF